MKSYKYLVLGGGIVAGYAAKEFVEKGLKEGELGIISADAQLPYERPPLSKDFLAGQVDAEGILINDADFYETHGIEVHLEDPVETVDLPAKSLQTRSGEAFGFEKLLVATGSRVHTFDLPGADQKGVHYLRWLEDARQIREGLDAARRAVVIGGGFIGMEVASQLVQKEIETTMVFPEARLMEGLFTPHMSAFFRRYYEERGVSFVTQALIASFVGDGQVEAVKLRSGQELAADFVVAGIGVSPAVELFQSSELELDSSSHGIVVNEYLEAGMPDVYAAGDVASYRDVIFERQRHIEHWDNAARQGQHVAGVMMGEREPFERVPYFFSDVFDLSWEFWGDTQGAASVLHRGEVASGSFSAWWFQEEQLVAAFVMDRPGEEREAAREWIKSGRQVLPVWLADETQSLR